MDLDITVIIPTYNREKDLERTLEGMVRAEKGDLAVEVVVVDNGSTDQTKSVVDSFHGRIPIHYLFEARSGKNRALNTALERSRLGRIIVFTDDDVDVSPDWFISIHSVCDRWPNHSIFGGRIDVIFPVENIPAWASDPYLSAIGFARHNWSDKECIYSYTVTPFGPNYWVRREVFDKGRRFDEAIGPHPTNRITGDETSFLIALVNDGYEIVYSPTVIVGHRVKPEMLNLSTIYKRAYQCGRGQAHIYYPPAQTKLTRIWPKLNENFLAWRFYRTASIILHAFMLLASFILSSKTKRPPNVAKKVENLGYRVEAIRLLRERPN